MKKLFLSLGAMLVVGIASAQVNNQGNLLQTPGATSQISTTTKQDNALTQQKPVATPAGSNNTLLNPAPSAVPVTPTMPSPTTTNSMTNTPTSSDMSRSSNNSGTATGTSGATTSPSGATTGTSGHINTGTTSTTRTP